MDNHTNLKPRVSLFMLTLLFLLVTMGKYNLYLGFALKPYMLFCILFIVFHLSSFRFRSFQLFEVFLFLFYFAYVYSGAFSLHAISSLRILLGVILYLACYIVIKDILSGASQKIMEKALGISGILFNLISLGLYVIGLKQHHFSFEGDGVISYGVLFDRDYPRLIGVLQDPNFYIFYNTIFFTYFLCNGKRWWHKVGLLLSIITSLLTFSRGGLLAMVIVFLLYFLMNRPLQQAKLLLGSVVMLSFLAYLAIVQLKFDFYGILESRVEDFSQDGGSGRFDLWARAWEFFSTHQIFGIGAFNYPDYNFYYFGDSHYVHNTFLDILSESGLIGLFFYLIFAFLLVFQLVESRMYRRKPYLFLTLIGFMLQMLSLSLIINDMFFLYLAILSAYLYADQKERKREAFFQTNRHKPVFPTMMKGSDSIQ